MPHPVIAIRSTWSVALACRGAVHLTDIANRKGEVVIGLARLRHQTPHPASLRPVQGGSDFG